LVSVKGRDPEGYYEVALGKISRPIDWPSLEQAFNEKATIVGTVTAAIKGGLSVDVGVRAFDSSHGGLGGCPYAPGATGNIVTEDLVFLLESMGLRTGVDIERLIEARSILAAGLPGAELYGHLADAGLPKGFAPATAAA